MNGSGLGSVRFVLLGSIFVFSSGFIGLFEVILFGYIEYVMLVGVLIFIFVEFWIMGLLY